MSEVNLAAMNLEDRQDAIVDFEAWSNIPDGHVCEAKVGDVLYNTKSDFDAPAEIASECRVEHLFTDGAYCAIVYSTHDGASHRSAFLDAGYHNFIKDHGVVAYDLVDAQGRTVIFKR